jgi:3-phosphoglycerate kinase
MTDTNNDKDTFESFYNKITTYGQMGFYVGEHSVREIVEVLKQLHNTEIKYWKDLADFKNNQNIIMSREKDKVISLRNIEITQRKQDYKELQAEIKHEKETSCLAIMKVEDDKKKLQAELQDLKIRHHCK